MCFSPSLIESVLGVGRAVPVQEDERRLRVLHDLPLDDAFCFR
jgi:hypothetical protein